MNKKLLYLALVLGTLAALPSHAHELRLFGQGGGKFGELYRLAFGLAAEPAREDQENGIDFTSLFYADGSEDGNVVDVARGDKVDITRIEILFFAPGEPDENGNPTVGELKNWQIICDKTADPPITDACLSQNLRQLNTFRDPKNPQPDTVRNDYENKFRPTDSGIYGFKLTGCIQDVQQQPDKEQADSGKYPAPEHCLVEETFICGPGSQDPRNDPAHPAFDGRFHSFSCVTDAVAFGAEPQKNGKDKASYKDNDKFSVPDTD